MTRLRELDPFFVGGFTLALACLIGLAIVDFVGAPPYELTLSWLGTRGYTVTDVPVGGPAWSDGIRPGMTLLGVEPTGADPSGGWESLLLTAGSEEISVPRRPASPGPAALVAGVALLAFAGLTAVALPNVASLLVMLAICLTTLVLAPLFGPPANAILLIPAPLVGALYATGPRRRLHALAPLVAAGLVVGILAAWVAAFVARIDDWHVPPVTAVVAALGLWAIGLVGATQTSWRRAIARGANGGARSLAMALLDELVPGRTSSRLSAIERERIRLADELHADVLPDLSVVIRELEAGASPREAAIRLRAISMDLRELMTDRRLSVLEDLGLVEALEWLAERLETRTGVRIELDVAVAAGSDPPDRPPREVELAVYRIAQQALDNALLHARPRAIGVRVDARATRVALEIADDGSGLDPGAEVQALRAGRLGLSDMHTRAEAVDAVLTIGPGQAGGTRVTVRWPA